MPIHDAGDLFGSVGGVQMPARSGARSAGGANLGPLEATANTIYLPILYNLDGFDQVTVNVPPYYVGIQLSADSFAEAMHVSAVYPSDGTQIGETLLDIINERPPIDGDARWAFGELQARLNVPGAGAMYVRFPVALTKGDTGTPIAVADMDGGAFTDAENFFSARFNFSASSDQIPQLIGASGSMGGMEIDTATFSQLMQTADMVEVTLYAKAKSTT